MPMFELGSHCSSPHGAGIVTGLQREYVQVALDAGGLEWYPALCLLVLETDTPPPKEEKGTPMLKRMLSISLLSAAALSAQWQCDCPSCTPNGAALKCSPCDCTQPGQPPPPPPPPPTTFIPAGANLQVHFDGAKPGDTLVLDEKGDWYGNFTLRVNAKGNPITVKTGGYLPPDGQRAVPGPTYPAIVSPNTQPALSTADGVSGWRFMGVAFRSEGYYNYGLVRLGTSDALTAEEQAEDIVLDRCLILADPIKGGKNGVELHGRNVTVKNSYVAGWFSSSQETHAIVGWNGPGPFTVTNNYLEASGISFLMGGALPTIPGLNPGGLYFARNFCTRPLEWRGKYAVKNLFELKSCINCTAEHNLFRNNWASAQAGMGILITPTCQSGGWAKLDNIVFRENVLEDSEGGINVLGQYKCEDGTYVRTSNVTITGNLLDRITNGTANRGRAFQVLSNATNVVIERNTAIAQHSVITFDGPPSTGFIFRDNISDPTSYGVFGSGKSTGTASLEHYVPGYVFTGNVLVGQRASVYPAGNHFPATMDAVGFTDWPAGNYTLLPASPFAGKGADMSILDRVRAEVPAGRSVVAGAH